VIPRFHILILFVLAALASVGANPADVNLANRESRYLSPGELAISPDGRRLFIVCERSDELRIVNTQTGKLIKRIAVGHVPRGLSVSMDGQQIYVANSWADTISVIDAQKLETVRTLPTGFEPISAVADRRG